jgi:hypothetical protein
LQHKVGENNLNTCSSSMRAYMYCLKNILEGRRCNTDQLAMSPENVEIGGPKKIACKSSRLFTRSVIVNVDSESEAKPKEVTMWAVS